jgi:hypothetical protein
MLSAVLCGCESSSFILSNEQRLKEKITVLWDVTPCSLVERYKIFRVFFIDRLLLVYPLTLQDKYYLQPARAALYQRTVLSLLQVKSFRFYCTEK